MTEMLVPGPESFPITIRDFILTLFESPEVILGVDDLCDAIMAEFMCDNQTAIDEINKLITTKQLTYSKDSGNVSKS